MFVDLGYDASGYHMSQLTFAEAAAGLFDELFRASLAVRDAKASVRKRLFLMKYPHHPDLPTLDIAGDDHRNVRDDQ